VISRFQRPLLIGVGVVISQLLSQGVSAEETCIKLGGTRWVSSEQRENLTGEPGNLIEKKEYEEPIQASSDTSSWCVSDTGVTYLEPPPKGSKDPIIRLTYPFSSGFVENNKVIAGKNVEIVGIARKDGDVISINWKYTLGPKISKADLPKNTSSRVELSFSFELLDGRCVVKSYQRTFVANAGIKGPKNLYAGFFIGTTTLRADPTCSTN
jgi:hypothetical protein